jgi:hypothetical protein
MQIIHLLMADAAWISMVLLGAAALAHRPDLAPQPRTELRPMEAVDERHSTT